MNISIEKVKLALDRGIDILTYIHMKCIDDGCLYLFSSTDCFGIPDKLYIQEGELTKFGLTKLQEIEGVSNKVDKIDYKALNLKLKERLQLSHGSKQTVGFGGIFFIPTVPELEEFLKRFWKNYPEYKDINKIMACLEAHIVKCSKEKKFAPAIKYFIYKVGTGSQLANAYENYGEILEKKEEISTKINTKELF